MKLDKKNKKRFSRTSSCGLKVMYAAMQILSEHDGSCRVADLRTAVSNRVEFTSWDMEITNGGNPRWFAFMSYYSTCYVVAGFIQKSRGTWHLTDDGQEALSRSPEDVFTFAIDAYDKSKAIDDDNKHSTSTDVAVAVSSEELSLDDVREKADSGIREFLASRSPYQFQDIVASLLRAMGFYTPFISPKGRDGGVDVLAFHDPLGTSTPRVKVQVKHYPNGVVSVDVVRQLIGLLNRDGDVGVVVTSGLFTSEAQRAARESHRSIRLIDGDEFVSLWISYYSKMPEEDKSLLRITPVYFISD
ncbi:restriction endonuclease [Hallella bergensis]|uniref:restriction endonuclease n=1 Tax=Hallella bergensis TaxID=242750 RepID=UPI0023F0E50C|nr:restriction endonuclease [Hallella bergensis]